jgi:hypothetical protein
MCGCIKGREGPLNIAGTSEPVWNKWTNSRELNSELFGDRAAAADFFLSFSTWLSSSPSTRLGLSTTRKQ